MDLEGLSNKQQRVVQRFIRDGVITEKERAKLEKLGLSEEIMAELSSKTSDDTGELPPCDDFIFNEEKPKWKKVLKGVGIGVAATTAAVVAAPYLISGLTAGAIFKTLGLVGIGAAALFGLSGCKMEIHLPDNYIYDSTNVSVIFPDDEGEKQLLLQEIELLKEMLKNDKTEHNELMKRLDNIILTLSNVGNNVQNIVDYLKDMGVKLSDITNIIVNNAKDEFSQNEQINEKLDRILEALDKGNDISENANKILVALLDKVKTLENTDISEVEGLLDQILEEIAKSTEQNRVMDDKTHELLQSILDNIQNLNGDVKKCFEELLGKLDELSDEVKAVAAVIAANYEKFEGASKEFADNIIAELNKGNEIDAKTLDVATKILEKDVEFDTSEIEDLIRVLTDKVQEHIIQDKVMDDKTHELLQSILDNIQNFNDDMKTGFGDVISKLDNMDKDSKALLQSILDNIQNFNDDMKTGFGDVLTKLDTLGTTEKDVLEAIANLTNVTGDKVDSLLKAIVEGQELDAKYYEQLRCLIVENNEITEETKDLVKDLGYKVDLLGQDIKAILEKLGNGQQVDLTAITVVLEAINKNVEKNNELVDLGVNTIAQSLNTILATVTGIGDETKAILLKILAKIPNECKCEPADLTVIIKKLEEIIVKIEENPTGNHEGILDDFENTMNGLI